MTTGSTEPGIAVGEKSVAREAMDDGWIPVQDLLGGTERMRAVAMESQRHLPQMEKESDSAYETRVAMSFLHNFYADNVAKLVAKPYAKAVSVKDGPPEHLEPMVVDMDMNGVSLQKFSEESFRDALNFGMSHCLVDYTEVPENVEAKQRGKSGDRKAELQAKPRPRAILISPADVLGWRTKPGPQGETVLSMIRFRETRDEADGDFGEKKVHHITVWTETDVQKWRKEEGDDEYTAEEARPHTLGRIPWVTWYANRKGFLLASPPLLDLAWVTIDHWQSYSDQRTILHVARVPILFRRGMSSKEADKRTTVIGSSRMVTAVSEKAMMSYVEPSGGAIASGKEHLEMLERRADLLGAEPLRSRGPATATGEVRAESKATAWILSWVEAQEQFLVEVFKVAASWTPRQAEVSEEFRVQIPKDFGLTTRASEEYKLVQQDHKDGAISGATRLAEGKRRGIYDEDFDPDKEARLAEAEGLPLAAPEPGEEGA